MKKNALSFVFKLISFFLFLVPVACQEEDQEAILLTNFIPIDCETLPEGCNPNPPSPPTTTPTQKAVSYFKASPFYQGLYSPYKSRLVMSLARYSYNSSKGVTSLLIPMSGGTPSSKTYLDVMIPGKVTSKGVDSPDGGTIPPYCLELIFGIAINVTGVNGIPLGSSKYNGLIGKLGHIDISNASNGRAATRLTSYSNNLILTGDYPDTPGSIPDIGCSKGQAEEAEKCFIGGIKRNFGAGVLASFICPECVLLGLTIGYVDCYLRECNEPLSPKKDCLQRLLPR